MKSLFIAIVSLSAIAFADGPGAGPGPSPSDSFQMVRAHYVDSMVAAHEAQDAQLFAALPDSIRPMITAATQAWKVASLADTDQDENQRVKTVDSLRTIFTGRRDSLLVLIDDATTRDQVRTRIGVLETVRSGLKAKLEARRAEIAAEIAGMKGGTK